MTAARTDDRRLTLVGNIPVDLSLRVDRLPVSGEDLLGRDPVMRPGGGFHVLAAARRLGLRGRFIGAHGTGPLGDLVRRGLAEIGCELVLPPTADVDTGWSVGLVEASGQRTFVSAPDAVVAFSAERLGSLRVPTGDLVYVSGYSLGLGAASRPLADWVAGLSDGHLVCCDLGPWGSVAADALLQPVLRRVDWLACNTVEAAAMTSMPDPALAGEALRRRTDHAGVLVRLGAEGCWCIAASGGATLVAADPVSTRDTTGAGDAHTGAFLAALARGDEPRSAVAVANAAAAAAIGQPAAASWRPGVTGPAGQEA